MQNKITQLQTLAFPNQQRTKTVVLFGLFILSLFVSLYVFFVGKIVFDVVAERGANMSIRASQSAISTLEVDYYNKIKTVTLAQAPSLGLAESNDTLYAIRTDKNTDTAFLLIKN